MAKQSDSIDLEDMNHSELVLMMRWAGMRATRAIPREDLITALRNLSPVNYSDSIETMRSKVNQWMVKYWPKLRMSVEKHVCPNCQECRDLQAYDCYYLNRKVMGGNL
jgi:hypothetical protein